MARKKTNTTAIGLFVIGAVALFFAGVIYLGSTTFSKTERYVLYFDESVNGLVVGAKVKFKGVPIGRVVETFIGFNSEDGRTSVPVIIEIDKKKLFDEKGIGFQEGVFSLEFRSGLRAKLVLESLITGVLFIDIDYYGNEYPGYDFEGLSGRELVIPTLQSDLESIRLAVTQAVQNVGSIDFEEISGNLNDLLTVSKDKVDELDIETFNANLANLYKLANLLNQLLEDGTVEKTLSSITATSDEAQKLIAKTNKELDLQAISAELTNTLAQLTAIGDSTRKILKSDSEFRHEFSATLNEINTTARSIRVLVDLIERNPKIFLTGKPQK